MNTSNHIVIMGMMGSGKTTLGKIIANKLGRDFIDLDQFISDKHNDNIDLIIQKFGIEDFRIIEERSFQEVVKKCNSPAVISLGGGTFSLRKDLKHIENFQTVFLKCNLESLTKRILGDTINLRPLVKELDEVKLKVTLSKLLQDRTELYNNAKIHFDTTNGSIEVLGQNLYELLRSL